MIIKKAVIDKANRLYQLPPDIFSFAREKTRPARLKRIDLLDLARFNWPIEIEADKLPTKAQFAPAGKKKISELKEALADWLSERHSLKVNPAKEIHVGGGISSLIFATALAFVDNGDIVFVPELGLPLYKKVTTACGGEPVHYTVSQKNDWQPDFERINTRLGRVARLLFLNSPHNPTGASLSEKQFEDLVWMAARENIVVVNDAAYQSVSARPPASLLAASGGKKVGIEVYSFSYQFGLPAWPFGFAVGNRDVISGLELAANLLPSFIPDFFVDAAITAIHKFPNESLRQARDFMQRTAAEATKFLGMMSFEKSNYDTIPFLWAQITGRKHARTQASILYRRSRILSAPGTAFGDSGEGFLRFSLTASPDDYKTAHDRAKKKLNLLKVGDES